MENNADMLFVGGIDIKITISKNDGFGSQFLSILSGMAFARKNNLEYVHTNLYGFKLEDKNEYQNEELNEANNLLLSFMKNCGVKTIEENESCYVYGDFHQQIQNGGYDYYYDESFLDMISNAYPLSKPTDFLDTHNVSIHIRRGDDMVGQEIRIVQFDVYDKIISRVCDKFPNSKIRVFSWTTPDLRLSEEIQKRISYHTVFSGEKFLEHFNMMVHSDVLIVGNSTFSVSAGLLNKNNVLCSSEIHKILLSPNLQKWTQNYKEILDV